MTYKSIEINNKAIECIDIAIKNYNEGKEKISIANKNPKVDGIIKKIENEIEKLKELKNGINRVSTNINDGIKAKEKRDAEEREKARREEEAQRELNAKKLNNLDNAPVNKNTFNKIY